MIKLIIVDDQNILIDGLKKLLEAAGDIQVIGTYNIGEVVERACERQRPDMVLMDICMEGRNSGITTARALKSRFPQLKVIVMTGFAEVSYLERAKEAGADSFIYKESSGEEFIACVRETAAGGHVFPAVKEPCGFGEGNTAFTDREREILRLVCRNMSYQEIAEELKVTKRTVSFHISNMLSKTGHKSIVGLAVEAANKGYADEMGG